MVGPSRVRVSHSNSNRVSMNLLLLLLIGVVAHVKGETQCDFGINHYICRDSEYCCNLTECCYYVYSLWWFWTIWIFIFLFLSILSCWCIRRRRQRIVFVNTGVPSHSYGTVVTSTTSNLSPHPPAGYSSLPSSYPPPYQASVPVSKIP